MGFAPFRRFPGLLFFGLWLLTVGLLAPQGVAAQERLVVFAAASMSDALTEIGAEYEADTGAEVVFSFAGTGPLARQLEAGAPADVFVAADNRWMDYAVENKSVAEQSRTVIASNTLVLIGTQTADTLSSIDDPDALLARLDGARFAMADPETVPAGRYGKQSLQALGLWEALEPQFALMENVRVALAAVARGETPLGLVYGSDAVVEPRAKVLVTLPQESHSPIVYPAALTTNAAQAAASFLDYLHSPKAEEILQSKGFLSAKSVE